VSFRTNEMSSLAVAFIKKWFVGGEYYLSLWPEEKTEIIGPTLKPGGFVSE